MKLSSLALCVLTGISSIHSADRQALERQIAALVTNGSVLLNDESGNRLYSLNPDRLLVPASIIKILTSAVALDVLGREYRFRTEFYMDKAGNLAIKGWGDPFLVSEEIQLIAEALRTKGITTIQHVCIDHSSFIPGITIPGASQTLNPYDAINGALVTNFNTLNLKKDAQGKILSAEEVTPVTPLALSKTHLIKAGAAQRISLSENQQECLRYAGELFIALFRTSGILVHSDTVSPTIVDKGWTLVHIHRNSKNLVEVRQGLQKYSNNFIANQIFLTVGAEKLGYPASLDKGRTVFEEYVRTRMSVEPGRLIITEGSGLSRDNKVTGAVMMYILERFKDQAEVLPVKKNALVKSGTLTGVSNYAGYIKTAKGLRPFVIILNQPAASRDRILDLLIQYCAEAG